MRTVHDVPLQYLLKISDTCLDGHIAIWNATFQRMGYLTDLKIGRLDGLGKTYKHLKVLFNFLQEPVIFFIIISIFHCY